MPTDEEFECDLGDEELAKCLPLSDPTDKPRPVITPSDIDNMSGAYGGERPPGFQPYVPKPVIAPPRLSSAEIDRARIEALEFLAVSQADLMLVMKKEIQSLRSESAARLPEKELPYFASLTDDQCTRIIKLRADLFANTGKGKPKHDIKLFVWFDHKEGKIGHIKPLHFWVSRAGSADTTYCRDTLFGKLVDMAPAECLIGCVIQKINGTSKYRDHVAVLDPISKEFFVRIRQQTFIFPEHEIPVPRMKRIDQKTIGKSTLPTDRWYWNRPAG